MRAVFALFAAFFHPLQLSATERTWLVIPILMVNPENGVGAGLKYVNTPSPVPSSVPSHAWDLHFYLTTKGQWEMKVEHLRGGIIGGNSALRSEGHFFAYPESFFGQGNAPEARDEVIYHPRGGRLRETWEQRMWSSLYLKGSGYAQWVDIRKVRSLEPWPSGVFPHGVSQSSGGVNDLWSLSLEWDSRDQEKAARQGWYAGQKAGHSLFSTDFRYGWHESWVAAYSHFGGGFEVAAKLFQQSVMGSPPFYELPHLGDKRLMRGVTRKRLRDRSAQAVQTELRYQFEMPLPERVNTWQAAVFAESGRVGESFADASQARLHISGGIGGRLVLGRRAAVLRGDLGFSASGAGIYIDFGQAF